MTCSNCGRADDGFRATLKGSELEWIEDTLEDGDDIHEDGHWDGEHFYPSAG